MRLVLVVLVDTFLDLNIGEPQKLMELLETEVGLEVVVMVVNTTTPLMVVVDQTIKVAVVVKDHIMILATTKLLATVSQTLAVVEVEDHLTIMVVEMVVELLQDLVDLALLLLDIKFNYHAQQTKVSLTPLSIGFTLC